MTAVASPPPAAPPAPPQVPPAAHGRPRQHSDFAEVLDRLPRAEVKDNAPAAKQKGTGPEASDPPKPPAGAEAWAALLALSQPAAGKPPTERAPETAKEPLGQSLANASPLKAPPTAPPPASPAVAAKLVAARAFLAPSGEVRPALASAFPTDAFFAPAEAHHQSPTAEPEQAAGEASSTAAKVPAAVQPILAPPAPVAPALAAAGSTRPSTAKAEWPPSKPAPRPLSRSETAPEPGVARKLQPTAPAEKQETAASSAPAVPPDSRADVAAGVEGFQNPLFDLGAPQRAPSSAPDKTPVASNASIQAAPTAATAPTGREAHASVREIDVDLAPGGLEDVSMTMRLQGERLSVVFRAGSGQTASAIEGAREAIAESLAAIGQPLASLVIERTNASAEGNGTNDGFEHGQRPQDSGDDLRGGRRGASRGF